MDGLQRARRVGKYLLGEVLGTGATGMYVIVLLPSFSFRLFFKSSLPYSVRYALNTETGEKVAIKIIDIHKLKSRPGLAEQVEREARYSSYL